MADDIRGRFRAAFRAAPQEIVQWLEPFETDDQRPPTAQGRVFRSFVETFPDVLAWYKPAQLEVTRSHGLTLDPVIVERVRDAVLRLCALTGVRGYDAGPIARYTALDHRVQTMLGAPVRRVLDFGSGIGRMAFAWAPDASVVSVDVTESLYLVQREAYRALYRDDAVDALDTPDAIRGALEGGPKPGVVHLPSWELDAVPDRSVSLIVAVHVLQEVPEPTLRYVLDQFRRVIAPGGLLYIRDKEFWAPRHQVRVGRALLLQGYELAYRFPGSEGRDINGIPRLWVHTGDDTRRYLNHARRLKRVFLPSYGLGWRSWRDYGLPI